MSDDYFDFAATNARIQQAHTEEVITKEEFCEFLKLLMVSDPWPEGVDQSLLIKFADREAEQYHCKDWIEAYHGLM